MKEKGSDFLKKYKKNIILLVFVFGILLRRAFN